MTIEEFLSTHRGELPVIVKISEANRLAGHWKSISAVSSIINLDNLLYIL